MYDTTTRALLNYAIRCLPTRLRRLAARGQHHRHVTARMSGAVSSLRLGVPRRGRTALDFSRVPEGARTPGVLLLDGTYFATGCNGSPVLLSSTIARLVTALQPGLTVCAFDNGERKTFAPGSVDARRAARSPRAARGNPAPLAAALQALHIPCVLAPAGAQGDDVLAALSHELAESSRCADLRVLVATGDADACITLRKGAQPGARVDWLRVAGHPCAEWPNVLTAVTWHAFHSKRGFAPERYAAFAAFTGRPRDGVKRVLGVGNAAAASLVHAHGADPALPDEAVLEAVLRAAETDKLRGYLPSVRAALVQPGARELLFSNLRAVKPRLDAAVGRVPLQLQALL